MNLGLSHFLWNEKREKENRECFIVWPFTKLKKKLQPLTADPGNRWCKAAMFQNNFPLTLFQLTFSTKSKSLLFWVDYTTCAEGRRERGLALSFFSNILFLHYIPKFLYLISSSTSVQISLFISTIVPPPPLEINSCAVISRIFLRVL